MLNLLLIDSNGKVGVDSEKSATAQFGVIAVSTEKKLLQMNGPQLTACFAKGMPNYTLWL